MIRQIKAFQHVRATGEATRSDWEPGKPTLKPGPKLVGKVWEVWKTDFAFRLNIALVGSPPYGSQARHFRFTKMMRPTFEQHKR